ncbi:MAG: DUF507 family protein [Bdellovibrionaceae bacterium]|nr:DUF507 family protein [Bdellovibrionales bacterium]MCB9086502.1 DUF507 family protein [Pseudobdellovibrionaceae bacterium]
MILSEERQSHLAHIVVDGLWNDDLVDYEDDEMAMRFAKQAVVAFVAECESIDAFAREKVASLKRGVTEGSPEWDVMYGKYFEEEMVRRGNK